jgi:hypothetical protein
MNTPVMARSERMNVALFVSDTTYGSIATPKRFKKDNGALAIQGVPVFRSGTFRDSMGMQHGWEDLHMEQMVANFNVLKSQNILTDVPVRDGHPSLFGGGGTVVGFHTGLSTAKGKNLADGSEYTYLLADFEILDPAAQVKYDAGLFRNRSSEVGEYVTNNETAFWPTYMGFAFVDIPAVEGLNHAQFAHEADRKFTILMEKGLPVTTEQNKTTDTGPAVPPPGQSTQTTTEPSTNPASPDSTPAAQPPATHSGQTVTQTFSINGQPTSDFAAVQSHITKLENFARESNETARKDFVKGLVTSNHASAVQTDSLTAFALSLSDELYDSWKASWQAAPVLSVLSVHGAGNAGSQTQTPEKLTVDQQALKDARETVSMHKRGGMTQENLEKVPSYKTMVRLEAAGVQA